MSLQTGRTAAVPKDVETPAVQGVIATCAIEPPNNVSRSSSVTNTARAIPATRRLKLSCRLPGL